MLERIGLGCRGLLRLPRTVSAAALLWMTAWGAAGEDIPALLTAAEKSDYTATANYEEVMAFCRALDEESDRVGLLDFGRSGQDRPLPLLVLSQPPVRSASEAGRSGKPVILALGTMHGGEICGKEALLMLARDLARAEAPGALDHFVLLFAPVLNPDGNERFSTNNRPHQNGPSQGVGERGTAAGLDLNRDFVKLEAPETRALVRLLNQWDPAIVIDTHTTDGSYHRYALTYGGSGHPAGDREIQEYVRESFLPEVSAAMRAGSGYDSFFYGNFRENHTRWQTYPALPRYGTHYIGLRNRLALLSEAYVHASYRDRVLATKALVACSLKVAAQEKERMLTLLRQARERTIQAGEKARGSVPLRTRLAPFDKPVTVKGFVEEETDGKTFPTSTPKDYTAEDWARSEVVDSTTLPWAYLFPPSFQAAVTNLQLHGLRVEELREDLDLEVETYTVQEITRAGQSFQDHRLNSLTTTERRETRRVEAGTIVVRTGQALGRLAACLLEPEAEDGLSAWNFFDRGLVEGKDFPVRRLRKPVSLLTADVRPLPEDRAFGRRVTFETLHGNNRPNFNGSPAKINGWLKKGRHYLQVRRGELQRVDALTGKRKPFVVPEKVAGALRQLPEFDEKAAADMGRRTSWQMNPAKTGALLEHNQDLYFVHFDGSKAMRLTRSPGQEELATFSPDGRRVAFVRGQNLYAVDLATQTERPLTVDGGGDIWNGKACWIYFEEVYDRNWKTFWWSPDSAKLAFHRFDESCLPTFHALDTLSLHSRLESMRHPKAGDPNPVVQLGVVSIDGGPVKWIDLSGYTDDFLISRVGWMPRGRAVYFHVQDRAQTWLEFNVCELAEGRPTPLFRETTKAWVDEPGEPRFLKNGDFILPSARTGYVHLYRFSPKHRRWTALTSGDWQVSRIQLIDQANDWIYFTATRDSAIADNLYRCRLDGRDLARLTCGSGTHRVSLDPSGALFVDSTSDYSTPEKVALYKTDGTRLRTLDSNPVYALEEFQLGAAALFQVKCQDGFLLEASMVKPVDFSPEKRYPVWLMTYAGPNAPTIRNTWGQGRLYDQMLAEMGLVAFRMDPRSASGKGSQFTWTAYRQLGRQELADITEAVEWLKQKPFVDPARIGMSGHSYGGFMTAYALTHSQLFAAGIAGAAVTDWRYYDTIYTERYMDTPQNNAGGYDAASVVKAARHLHGRLLLLHGMMDDNVHLQNATALADALQKAAKDFELMFYPTMQHGIYGAHYDRLTVDFIRRTFGLEGPRLFEEQPKRAQP